MVSASERLSLTLFMAGLVHAALILGIGFELTQNTPKSRALEIALIKQPNLSKPVEADFLAQENQQGSGDLSEVKRASDEATRQPNPQPVQASQFQDRSTKAQAQRALTQKQAKVIVAVSKQPVPEDQRKLPNLDQLMQQQQDFAKRLSDQEQRIHQSSRRPRKLHINSISAQKSIAASYEAAWQQKVERIGNLNYPDEVRRKKLSGTLILSAELDAEGRLLKIIINRRSGHQAIDDAAVRIVKLASPFAPFPPDLRKEADILVITRTWQFLNQGAFKTR